MHVHIQSMGQQQTASKHVIITSSINALLVSFKWIPTLKYTIAISIKLHFKSSKYKIFHIMIIQ